MNRLRTAARRAAAVVASALLGLAAGAMAVGTPASADHLDVSSTCTWDSESSEWVVTWTVTGTAAPVTAEEAPEGSLAEAFARGDPDGPLVGVQRLNGDAGSASLTVRPDDDPADETYAEVAIPRDCGGLPESPAEVAGWDLECDLLTVTLDNPTDEPVALTLAPDPGSAVDIEVADGESATVQFPATEGLSVDIRFDGRSIVDPDQPIEVSADRWAELGCADQAENSGEDGGEGGGLPATGTPIGLVALGALALLGLGAGLYLVARRRRIRFTA